MKRALLALALLACQPSAPEPSARCATCHLPEFRAARNPVHVGERPTTCGICHTQASWRPSRLDHPWPLTGAHAKGHCFYCHHGDAPTFRGTKSDCIDCHRAEYEKAPRHERNPTTCATCHATEAWKPPLPNHPTIAAEPEPEPELVPDAGPPADAAPAPTKPKPKRPTPTPKPDVTTGSSERR
jgi:hypothetical protein